MVYQKNRYMVTVASITAFLIMAMVVFASGQLVGVAYAELLPGGEVVSVGGCKPEHSALGLAWTVAPGNWVMAFGEKSASEQYPFGAECEPGDVCLYFVYTEPGMYVYWGDVGPDNFWTHIAVTGPTFPKFDRTLGFPAVWCAPHPLDPDGDGVAGIKGASSPSSDGTANLSAIPELKGGMHLLYSGTSPIELKDIPFPEEEKITFVDVYRRIHPEAFPAKLMREMTMLTPTSGILSLGATLPNGGNEFPLGVVRWRLTWDSSCVQISQDEIVSLGEFPIAFNDANTKDDIQMTGVGFGFFHGTLLGGRFMADVPFQFLEGDNCASEDARRVHVELVEAEWDLDNDSEDNITRVTLEGRTSLQFRQDTKGVLVELSCFNATGHVVPNDDGYWLFEDVPPGKCTLRTTAPGYLPTIGSIMVGGEDLVVSPNQLLGGDINGDGVVALDDITVMIAKFTKSTVNCEIDGKVVDIDCDGVVALSDITGAITNFAKTTQPFQ